MGWEELTPSDDTQVADWIGERLHPFAQDVGSVVPTGFAAYARIFHPAWRYENQNQVEVRWSEVAAWSGRTVHREMQFHSIALPRADRGTAPMLWDGEPALARLTPKQFGALAALLPEHTSTPEVCWFGVWDGYGEFNPGATAQMVAFAGPLRRSRFWWWRFRQAFPLRKPHLPHLPQRQRVRLPSRDYLLFSGTVVQVSAWQNGPNPMWRDGPNLWWPADHAWCVASEIDFPYTYVGGSEALIAAVLADPGLEALQAELGDGITYGSDKLNTP